MTIAVDLGRKATKQKQRYYECHNVNMLTTCGLSILMHDFISLSDATPYDDKICHMINKNYHFSHLAIPNKQYQTEVRCRMPKCFRLLKANHAIHNVKLVSQTINGQHDLNMTSGQHDFMSRNMRFPTM